MNKIGIVSVLLFISTLAFSQSKSKIALTRSMNDVKRYILFSNYKSALPFAQHLLRSDTSNANFNYLVGICYFHLPIEKTKAIPYLQKASRKINPNYNEYSIAETKAPAKVWLYLGKSYQSNFLFDKAIEAYNKYNEITANAEKNQIDQLINSCASAKKLTKDSIDISIENIGGIINSEYDEHTPVISTDENTLIFTSRRKGSTGTELCDDGRFYEDIYISTKEQGKWTSPKPISTNINTNRHDASITLSADETELFIYKDDFGFGNIYVSKKTNDIWAIPVKLGSNINTTSNESHATISPDGRTLIFTSDRKEGMGGRDLYICHRLPDGNWGFAVNMGDNINTPFEEEGPFFHPDGYTLYFSSTGHNTMGGFDLFYCELTEEGTWSKPKNMGYPINTPEDELFYVISTDGKRAYFSSVRADSKGGSDIYIMNLLSIPEKSSTVVKGTIKVEDPSINPDDVTISVKDLVTKKTIGKYKPNKETGVYTIILKQGRDYEFTCEADNITFSPEIISIPDRTAFSQMNKPLELKPIGVIHKK